MSKLDLFDAGHPARRKAIEIMDFICDYLGKPKLFDCKNGSTKWYDVEDRLTKIIVRRK